MPGSRCVAQGCSNSSKNSLGISLHCSPVEQFVEKLTSWLLKIAGSEEPFEVMADEVKSQSQIKLIGFVLYCSIQKISSKSLKFNRRPTLNVKVYLHLDHMLVSDIQSLANITSLYIRHNTAHML